MLPEGPLMTIIYTFPLDAIMYKASIVVVNGFIQGNCIIYDRSAKRREEVGSYGNKRDIYIYGDDRSAIVEMLKTLVLESIFAD